MAAVELPGLRRVAYGVVLAQAVLTAVLAVLWLRLQWVRTRPCRRRCGGGIGTAANLTLALIVFRKGARELMELVRAFYIA